MSLESIFARPLLPVLSESVHSKTWLDTYVIMAGALTSNSAAMVVN